MSQKLSPNGHERMTKTFFITPHMKPIKRVPDLSATAQAYAFCIVFTFAICVL